MRRNNATRNISLCADLPKEVFETSRCNSHLEPSGSSFRPEGMLRTPRLIDEGTRTKLKTSILGQFLKKKIFLKNMSHYHLLRVIIHQKVHMPFNDREGLIFIRMRMKRRMATWQWETKEKLGQGYESSNVSDEIELQKRKGNE